MLGVPRELDEHKL
jgi:hypothetical protein